MESVHEWSVCMGGGHACGWRALHQLHSYMKANGGPYRVPNSGNQGACPAAIHRLASTTALRSVAAALTESTACCNDCIITVPGCATVLPPVADCAQSSLDLRYPNCCRSVTATLMTLIPWHKHNPGPVVGGRDKS